MKTLIPFLTVLLAWTAAPGQEAQLTVDEKWERIVILEMARDTMVNDQLTRQLRNHVEDNAKAGIKTALVISIDSGGGRTDAAERITELVQAYTEHEELRIFAYVQRSAISAAAWIAMACEGLMINPNAEFGDIQPLLNDFRGYERVPEKIVTKLANQLDLVCRKNGIRPQYPPLFVDAMVDTDVDIVAARNTRTNEMRYMRAEDFDAMPAARRSGLERHSIGLPGKALTTNGTDMVRYGFRVKLLDSQEEIVDFLGTPDADVTVIKLKSGSGLALFFDWTWLLVLGGFICLVMEMKTPGLGAFGILGILLFMGFFFLQSGWSDEALLPLALLVVGVFLIIVEVIILPGFGIAGISGLLLVLYATYASVAAPYSDSLFPFPDFGDPDDMDLVGNWAIMLTVSIVGGVAVAMAFGKMLHRIPILNKMVMSTKGLRSVGGETEASGSAVGSSATGAVTVSVGDTGEAATDLRPSGAALIGGRRVDVVAQGSFIADGTPIVVSEVEGFRVVVRPQPEGGTA